MTSASHQQRLSRRAILLSIPGTLWVCAFLLGPLLFVAAISFCSTGSYGEIERPFTSEHYRRFAGFGTFGWEPLYPRIVLQSVMLAAAATLLCLAAALPAAFFLADLPKRWKSAALVLVTVPLWTNLLIRTYAWQMLLSPGGAVAGVWRLFGGDPGALYPGTFAVYVGLVCDYLPFLLLPLYASVEKIDWTLAEAARDLGATSAQTFRHAIWPQIRQGTAAGVVLVLVPALAQFVIPDLLGGAKAVLLGNVIQQQFGPSQNWPFGSAIASITMIAVLAGLWLYARSAAAESETA